jgi:hypothetical protein
MRIRPRGNIEQALIRSRILHDGSCFSLHRKHHGPSGFLELFDEVAGSTAEGRQRLNVVRNVKQGGTFSGAIRVAQDKCLLRDEHGRKLLHVLERLLIFETNFVDQLGIDDNALL